MRTWIGGRFTRGDDVDTTPTHAVLQLVRFAADSDPETEAAALERLAGEAAANEHTHSVAWAVDPTRWDAVVLRLATEAPTADPTEAPIPETVNGTVYRVEHLSAPGLTELGRPLRG